MTGQEKPIISVAPKIAPLASHSNLQRGERLSLTCTISKGDTPIFFKWFRNGIEVGGKETEGTILNINDFTSIISIDHLESHHSGNYSCQATNKAGSFSQSVSIIVNGNDCYTAMIASRPCSASCPATS